LTGVITYSGSYLDEESNKDSGFQPIRRASLLQVRRYASVHMFYSDYNHQVLKGL